MKRKIAWLGLPLVLCALMLGVKWRAEHPTPTWLDLMIRAKLSHSFDTKVHNSDPLSSGIIKLPKKEFKEFVSCLYLHPQQRYPTQWWNDEISISSHLKITEDNNAEDADIRLPIDESDGTIEINGVNYRLHPVTKRRWLELLSNNPRIGPKIRKRLNQ